METGRGKYTSTAPLGYTEQRSLSVIHPSCNSPSLTVILNQYRHPSECLVSTLVTMVIFAPIDVMILTRLTG